MILILLKCLVSAQIAEYNLFEGFGQVLEDLGGNGYYLLKGDSALSGITDPVWTDRGAYFEGAQHLQLPQNALSKSHIDLPNSFIVNSWIYPLGSGTVFCRYSSGENHLVLEKQEGTLVATVKGVSAQKSSLSNSNFH